MSKFEVSSVNNSPSIEISLRDSTPDDLNFAFNLNKTNMRHYVEKMREWNDEVEFEDMRKKFTPGIDQIIQVDGKDIGLMRVVEQDDAVKLDHIELIPEFQNKGIGSKLIKELIEKTKDRDIVLQVLKINPAVNLYKGLGFEIESENESKYIMKRKA